MSKLPTPPKYRILAKLINPTKLSNSFKSYIKFPLIFNVVKFFLMLNFLKHDSVINLLCDAFKFSRFSKFSIPSNELNLLQLISKYFSLINEYKYLFKDVI